VRGFDVPKPVADLLAEISALDGLSLRGKTQTAVYRKNKPFLHFHWNDDGVVADVRYADDWERVPVDTAREQRKLVADVREFLAS
jgi:hypothetical protein